MSYEYCMGFLNTKAIELWFHFIEYCRKIDSNWEVENSENKLQIRVLDRKGITYNTEEDPEKRVTTIIIKKQTLTQE